LIYIFVLLSIGLGLIKTIGSIIAKITIIIAVTRRPIPIGLFKNDVGKNIGNIILVYIFFIVFILNFYIFYNSLETEYSLIKGNYKKDMKQSVISDDNYEVQRNNYKKDMKQSVISDDNYEVQRNN